MTRGDRGRPEDDIICTLSADGVSHRVEAWAALVHQAVGRADSDDGVRLTFPGDPQLAGRIAELAARERHCCAFLSFAVHLSGEGTVLEVGAPAGARAVLEALFPAAAP